MTDDPRYFIGHPWMVAVALFAAALFTWVVGQRLNGAGDRRHELLFVRVEHWSYPLVAAGIWELMAAFGW